MTSLILNFSVPLPPQRSTTVSLETNLSFVIYILPSSLFERDINNNIILITVQAAARWTIRQFDATLA